MIGAVLNDRYRTDALLGGSFAISWMSLLGGPVGTPTLLPVYRSTGYREYSRRVTAPDSALFCIVAFARPDGASYFPAWTEIVVSAGLRVRRDLQRRLDKSEDTILLPENRYPFLPDSCGKPLIQDGHQFRGIPPPRLNAGESRIIFQLLDTQGFTDFWPIAIGIEVGDGNPLVILATVMVI